MYLIEPTLRYARWAFSLSRKIIRIAPLLTAVVVAATLVSQLSLLLASVLPLKIILLLGSSGVPHYFPQSLAAFGREALVLGLGIATIGFYVLHLLAERTVASCNERASDQVLSRTAKLTLFSNQNEMARGAIRKLTRGIAAVIFSMTAIIVLAFIFPSVAFTLVGWCLAVFLVVSLAGSVNSKFRNWMDANAESFIGGMASIGFFAVVASIIVTFLLGYSFNVLFAVISLILSRQVMQRLSASVKDALTLSAQKTRINALFFHRHTLITQALQREDNFWDQCRGDRLAEWLPALLGEKIGKPIDSVSMTEWHETGLTDIVSFDVQATGENGSTAPYRVKLFNHSRRMMAAQETTLLSAVSCKAFPCLPFLGASSIEENNVLLFRGVKGTQLQAKVADEKMRQLLQGCWLYEPPADLVERYRRSHQLLGQRFSRGMGERLSHAALTSQAQEDVLRFLAAIEPIKELLEATPLFIHNPDMAVGSTLELETGKPVITEWGRWSLEPVGAGWPTSKRMLAAINPWLSEAHAGRPALAGVTSEQVQLAALAFAFQRQFARQRYNSALKLLPAMLDCIQIAGESEKRDRVEMV